MGTETYRYPIDGPCYYAHDPVQVNADFVLGERARDRWQAQRRYDRFLEEQYNEDQDRRRAEQEAIKKKEEEIRKAAEAAVSGILRDRETAASSVPHGAAQSALPEIPESEPVFEPKPAKARVPRRQIEAILHDVLSQREHHFDKADFSIFAGGNEFEISAHSKRGAIRFFEDYMSSNFDVGEVGHLFLIKGQVSVEIHVFEVSDESKRSTTEPLVSDQGLLGKKYEYFGGLPYERLIEMSRTGFGPRPF